MFAFFGLCGSNIMVVISGTLSRLLIIYEFGCLPCFIGVKISIHLVILVQLEIIVVITYRCWNFPYFIYQPKISL